MPFRPLPQAYREKRGGQGHHGGGGVGVTTEAAEDTQGGSSVRLIKTRFSWARVIQTLPLSGCDLEPPLLSSPQQAPGSNRSGAEDGGERPSRGQLGRGGREEMCPRGSGACRLLTPLSHPSPRQIPRGPNREADGRVEGPWPWGQGQSRFSARTA